MSLFDLVGVFGGLAIFLYGMNLMSDALFRISGSKLERVIESLTGSYAKAILFGAGVTAVIQSSSAATVMIVGFVNAGYMKLSNAIAIIMGSNIGTTATAWILSLLGIKSDNILINLLKPSTFSPILAFLGIIVILSTKDRKKKAVAETIFGFAILMMGMDIMSSTLKPLADTPAFINLMTLFQNPLLSLLIGTLITAILQSSSASVGILQALTLSGALSIQATISIILGQNIGTCVTSLISSVGTSNNAKRAAIAHLLFNVIGTVLFLIVFFVAQAALSLAFLQDAASPLSIAIVHSCFNLSITIILLPFIKQLEALTYFFIPKSQEEMKLSKFSILEDKFLATPSFALDQCFELISDMAEMDVEALELANKLKDDYNKEYIEKIEYFEKENDEYEDNLKKYCTKINAVDKSRKTAKRLSAYIQCVNDFERISDHIHLIQLTFEKLANEKEAFSEKALRELGIVGEATMEVLRHAVNAFKTNDQESAFSVEPLDAVINELQKRAIKKHTKRMKKLACTPQLGFFYGDILNSYVRISAYCTNIAVAFIQDNNEGVSEHAYQEYMKNFDENYKKRMEEYSIKYSF